ncbi:hypothetical protein [Anaerocolumna sp.]|nr:hypothetical protein [Anaerocolumna sp.]
MVKHRLRELLQTNKEHKEGNKEEQSPEYREKELPAPKKILM